MTRRTFGSRARRTARGTPAGVSVLVMRRPRNTDEPAHQSEERAQGEADPWPSGQRGQHDHQVHGRRHDVRGQTGADLPAEPGAVDPGAELVEPALVHLTVVDRKVESAQTRCRRRAPQHCATSATTIAAWRVSDRARRRRTVSPADEQPERRSPDDAARRRTTLPWSGSGGPARPRSGA